MISIKNISKKFEQELVLDRLSIRNLKNKITVIFGPNGCGKTTLLRCIAKLERIDGGYIKTNGKLYFVFQNPELSIFPWMKNLNNITIHTEYTKEEKERIVKDLINKLKFNLDLNKYPYQLSGGQQQQLIILRSIINDPDILLLDEPFKGLDIDTLEITKKNLLGYLKENNVTTLLTTHSLDEALFFADNLLIVSKKPMKVIANFCINFKERNENLISSEEYSQKRKEVLKILKKNEMW